MKRKPYSAGAVKFSFWFLEFRKMVGLLSDGLTFAEIRDMNEVQNIFGASTKERRRQIFATVSARVESLDLSFCVLFQQGDVTSQKQLALAAALAHDTLFFDFVREVIHEKLLLGNLELSEADLRIFFHHKQVQDKKVASWREQTIQRLGRAYRSMLAEAGLIGSAGKAKRAIYLPLLDSSVEEWLRGHDMNEIVEALSDR